jgi:hypothetical protein
MGLLKCLRMFADEDADVFGMFADEVADVFADVFADVIADELEDVFADVFLDCEWFSGVGAGQVLAYS